MKRALAAIAVSMVSGSCAPLLGPDVVAQTPVPGAAVPDARTAMAAARKACHVSTWQLWLSPYRWHVKLHDGSWNVRVPSFNGALNCAYYNVEIRAADGVASRCDTCFDYTAIIAAAK